MYALCIVYDIQLNDVYIWIYDVIHVLMSEDK